MSGADPIEVRPGFPALLDRIERNGVRTVAGNVIGVVVSKLNALAVARLNADIPQNINFAVKSSTLVNFLDARGFAYSSGQPGESLSVPDVAERAKAIAVEVRCEK